MAFRTLTSDPEYVSRLNAPEQYPALFCRLDWPTVTHFVTNFPGQVTADGQNWDPVNSALAFVELDEEQEEPVGKRVIIGLRDVFVPIGPDPTDEEAALGSNVELYLGLFKPDWTDPRLGLIYHGYVNATNEAVSSVEGGLLISGSLEVSDMFNPRNIVSFYHSVGTNGADTAQQLLVYVRKRYQWPT